MVNKDFGQDGISARTIGFLRRLLNIEKLTPVLFKNTSFIFSYSYLRGIRGVGNSTIRDIERLCFLYAVPHAIGGIQGGFDKNGNSYETWYI